MANMQVLDCCLTTEGALERVRYFPRQLLTAADMVSEQEYFRVKMSRHNRYLHGWGTVCGLEVVAASTAEMPWQVKVTPGYALGPWGDEIYVGEPVHIDLARCGPGAVTDPCEPDLLHTGGAAIGHELFLAIKYGECLAQPVRAMPASCACEEEACEYSRIRDSFQIECLIELPPSHQPKPPDPLLCDLINGKRLPQCLPCPAEPWVVLARVTLPASTSERIESTMIENITFRRQIHSTAILQEQLIACCCKKEPQPDIEADLAVAKEAINESPNFAVRYTITVTNLGPSEAQNVVVEDTLSPSSPGVLQDVVDFFPPDIWTEITPTTLRAELGNMQEGDQVELGFRILTALPDPSGNQVVNTATVKSDTADPNEANNTIQITTDLGIG